MKGTEPRLRVDVLNPDGRDAPVDYRGGVAGPEAGGHPPVNYWAFAAATGGQFHQRVDTVRDPCDAVIVLIRQRLGVTRDAVRALKAQGRRVLVSWKETGRFQIAEQTRWWFRRRQLRELLAAADGALAVTAAAEQSYRDAGPAGLPVHFVPTPYPVDLPPWDFSVPVEQRRGLFVGTRQFDVPGRRHAEALALANEVAREAGCAVTVLNPDGAAAARRLRALLPDVRELRVLEQRLAYPDYVREMARHRIVLQRDESGVPGQVAGDALLCRVVNVGGDGTTQRRAFPELAEPQAGTATLRSEALRLLRDEEHYRQCVVRAQQRAHEALSFAWVRRALRAALDASPARA